MLSLIHVFWIIGLFNFDFLFADSNFVIVLKVEIVQVKVGTFFQVNVFHTYARGIYTLDFLGTSFLVPYVKRLVTKLKVLVIDIDLDIFACANYYWWKFNTLLNWFELLFVYDISLLNFMNELLLW